MTDRLRSHDQSYLGIKVPALPESNIPIVEPNLSVYPQPNEYVWTNLKNRLQSEIIDLNPTLPDTEVRITESPSTVGSDLAMACHKAARLLRRSPVQIAEELAGNLPKPELVSRAYAQNGFVNFLLNTNTFGAQVLGEIETHQEQYGWQNIGNGQTVVIDCSSPNVAKYMSVGHLRTTIIGESLARINQATGYKVIRDNHLGDWGTQFGMLEKAYELWANDYAELRDNTDPVGGLYKLYVRIHETVATEKEAERVRLGDPKADIETPLEKEGKKWFKRLEAGDEKALELLKWATDQSLNEFQRVYDLLGTKYEYMLGESFYVSMLPSVLQYLRDQRIATLNDTGAMVVDLSSQHMNNLVVQKSDQTSLYSTRDLAALVARTAWFNPAKILYVVGEDQKDYFKQVFATFNLMTKGEGPELEHVYFGMIRLPKDGEDKKVGGKMSTRKGNVVFLEDLLNESIDRAAQKTNATDRNLTEDEKLTIARQVGVGSVIFFDLGQGRERSITFDWDKALSFDGRTAPYIQYAHARTKALLRRAQQEGLKIRPDWPLKLTDPTEASLIKHLSRFPEAVAEAQANNSPTIIAEHTYQSASLFSDFYKQLGIVNEPDELHRNGRLRLTQATARVISNGLNLLCIEAPERM